MKKSKTYNLEYRLQGKNGTRCTVIMYNQPFKIVSWKRDQLQKTTHKLGKLKIVPC